MKQRWRDGQTYITRPGHWHTGTRCTCGATFCPRCKRRTTSYGDCVDCGGTVMLIPITEIQRLSTELTATSTTATVTIPAGRW